MVCRCVGALIHLRKKRQKNAINSLAQSVFFLFFFVFTKKDMLSSVLLAKPFYPPSQGAQGVLSYGLGGFLKLVGLKCSPHATPMERKEQEYDGDNTPCCSGEY